MSQTGLVAWSQTAASNASADSAVNFAEGQAPSSLNDSGRALMASAAKYRDDTAGSLTTAGTTTAYTLDTNQVFSTLSVLNGQELTVRFDQANGATPTLNVDSLGAKALQIDGSTAVPAGMIAADSIWRLTYDNSIPAFILNGVSRVFSGTDITVTGTVTGGDLVATDDLTVGDDATISGDLAVTGNIAVNTNKFNVTGSSGNVSTAGTLAVTGASTLTGQLTANNASGVVAKNAAKAFAYFTVSGTTVSFTPSSQAFNVASVTRSGTAAYDLVFTSALADTNYVVVVTGASQRLGSISNRATTGFTVNFTRPDTGGNADPTEANILVMGL